MSVRPRALQGPSVLSQPPSSQEQKARKENNPTQAPPERLIYSVLAGKRGDDVNWRQQMQLEGKGGIP